MARTNGVESGQTTVLVDLGGILLHPPLEQTIAAGESVVTLRRIMSSSPWMQYEEGNLSEEECFTQLGDLHGFKAMDLATLIHTLRETATYDDAMLAVLKAIKQTPGVSIALASNISAADYHALQTRWDGAFWSTFDYVLISAKLGVRKPSLKFYRHVLAATGSTPERTYVVDDRPENILAALSLGMRGTTSTLNLSRRLINFAGNPIERGMAYLRQNVGETGDSLTPPFCLNHPPRLWNFFSGKPKFTSKTYPEDLDTTSLALVAMEYDAETANPILDEMLKYVDEDGFVQAYTDKTRPRVDAVIALNVLVAFHTYDRGHELPQTLDWIYNILIHRAYINGTRYYPHAEWFLYYVARLLSKSKDPALHDRLTAPLKTRLVERIGVEGDAFCLATRLLACNLLGVENHPDRERLKEVQMEDGGWEASCMYLFPGHKKEVGNRGTTTAFAVMALKDGL
ncbi:hypothetical protein BDV06DRAFT_232858 [Aspergillus oleicola]